MNKSFVTNSIALLLVVGGYVSNNPIIWTVGLFALSGAITNWLAVHMLFEKIPGLYGSGVIPARFEDFKVGIKSLMMDQFFTNENIDRFLSEKTGEASHINLTPVIEKVDLGPSFDSLIEVIQASSFGGMLSMLGGTEALLPLKEPFIEKMKLSLVDISSSDEFSELVRESLESPEVVANMQDKVADIIDKRLNELTPNMVKDIIQEMIRKHLGWLVVWGGIFGGLIGFLTTLVSI